MKTLRLSPATVIAAASLAGLAIASAQTSVTWLGGSGNWSGTGNWNFAGFPNNGSPAFARYDVFIDGGQAVASDVTLTGPITIDDLTISAGDALQLFNDAKFTFAATGDGTIVNAGQINFNSTGNTTELRLARDVTLSGGGTVLMTNNPQNRFLGVAGTERLTNANNTIRGAGQIGANLAAFTNNGVVISNLSSGIVIDPNAAGAINTGVLRAESGAVLTLTDGTFTNTGGIIEAVTGSRVDLSNAAVTGGTLQTFLSGVIRCPTAGGGTRLTGLSIIGNYEQINDADTTLIGVIANTGVISLNAAGNQTDLIASGDVMLTGGGTVTFSNSVNNRIYAAAAANRLTNVNNTISGAGQIGVNQGLLTNQSLIDATLSSGLTIDPTGNSISAAAGMTNTGTLRASAGGTLTLQDGKFDNTAGLVRATGVLNVNSSVVSGGTVDGTGAGQINLSNGSITDGVLNNSSSGILRVVGAGNSTLGGAVTNPAGGQIILNNDGDLRLRGAGGDSYSNAGSIGLNSSGNATDLSIGGDVTLSGGGTVTLGNNINNRIFGAAGTERLTNADQTIRGGGQLGVNFMALTNQALIVANQPTGLVIDPSAAGVNNTGTLRADAGAVLTLTDGSFTNTGGVIEAFPGSRVDLTNANVTGGALQTTGNGVIRCTSAGGGTRLAGLSLTGNYEHPNDADTTLAGTITNNGTIALNATANQTDLIASGDVILTGGGVITFTNSVNNRIYAAAGTNRLTNVNNTITGAGQIGVNQTLFTNQALIEANVSNPLTIDPAGNSISAGAGVTNTGTFRASNGGTLALLDGKFDNTGGFIRAVGSVLSLTNSAVLAGTVDVTGAGQINFANSSVTDGILTNSTTGVLRVVTSGNSTLGGTVTNPAGGQIILNNDGDLRLRGAAGDSYSNAGSITLNSSGNSTDLTIGGDVTVSGGGVITCTNNINNRIFGTVGTERFTNADQTISGGVQIGINSMALTNAGTIIANTSTGIVIDPSAGGVVNTGTLRADGGVLTLLGGSFSNTGGIIEARDGSRVELNNAAVSGGTLQTSGTGVIRGVSAGGGTMLAGLTNTGAWEQLNDLDATLSGTITNTGTMRLFATGNSTDLSVSGDVILTGGGTLTFSNSVNNRILGTGANRFTNVNNTISGAGQIGVNLTLLTNQSLIDASVSNSLTIDPAGSSGSASAGMTNTGTLRASTGGTLTLQDGKFDNTGGLIRAAGVLNVNSSAVSGGTVDVTGAGQINLSIGSITDGTLNNSSAGIIRVVSANNSMLGGTVTNPAGGQIILNNDGDLRLRGAAGDTYNNAGSIALNSSGNSTDLTIGGDVTLTGGGILTMSNNINNRIFGAAGTERFTNADQIISGGGQIGLNLMTLTNAGAIIANTSAGIVIDPAGGGAINTGTLRADAGAVLTLQVGSYTNTGGLIEARDGSRVDLVATGITGGTLQTTGTGLIRATTAGGGIVLTNLTNAGNFEQPNDVDVTLTGTITNSGVMALKATGNSTDINISGDVLLNGGGTLTLTNSVNNRIFGTGANRLTNADHTISGAGQLGLNTMAFTNSGTVVASQATSLTIDPGPGGMTNNGTLRALAGCTLIVTDGLTNFSGTTLTGGTYEAIGTVASPGSLRLPVTNIVTNAASIILDGPGANILRQDNSLSAFANFATNNGNLTIRNGRVFGTPGDYEQHAGSTTLDGGNLSSTSNTVLITAGTLRGNGTVFGNMRNAGTISPGLSAGQLAIIGNLTLFPAAVMEMEILGTAPVTGHDQLEVTGTVTLAGALNVSVGPALPAGSVLVILKAGTGAITGTFAGKPEGASFTAGGHTFSITYAGGDGNDVALTVVSGPSANPPVIVNFTLAAGTGAEAGQEVVDLTATGDPGVSYNLEASADLVNWSVVQTRTAAAGSGALSFHLAQSPALVRRYYRIRRP